MNKRGNQNLSKTEELAKKIQEVGESGSRKKYSRIILSCLSVTPWIGGILSAAAAADSEKDQGQINELQKQWLEEHTRMFGELSSLLSEVFDRLDNMENIDDRIQSAEYLKIVRRSFQAYDRCDDDIRRSAIRNIIVNSACISYCHDNVVKLFAEWINLYSELHFQVISKIFNNTGISRGEIWQGLVGDIPADNSAEADLYRLLIHDLSIGKIIRQYKPTNHRGQFILNQKSKRTANSTAKSPFDFHEPYELTELGKQFVHYVLTDSVRGLES